MNIIERLQAAWSVLTSKNFIVFSNYNDEVGFVYTLGDHDEVMNLLQGGNQYLMENKKSMLKRVNILLK